MNSRKRPAPGTSPLVQQTTQQQQGRQYPNNSTTPQLTNDQFLTWDQNTPNHALPSYSDPTSFNPNMYGGISTGSTILPPNGTPIHQAASTPPNQLTRRPTNQHLVARGRLPQNENHSSWTNIGNGALQEVTDWGDGDDDDATERKALAAKRDAESKHKNIPPFVQKLSSFLEESAKNFSLIRWSPNGDSFIVVDEDDFAKTLIPELFKHNNYASFVRQLNMYGFHKKVGLSDNSMNASADGKRKTPSEYSHPYFQRGRPNLLWLINKPKNTKDNPSGGKRGERRTRTYTEEGDYEDDERDGDADHPNVGFLNGQPDQSQPTTGSGLLGIGGDQPLIPLPAGDLSNVRQELQTVRKQQKIISDAIRRLRQDHHQLYEQAVAFQTLHDRHESSINAILTFLATVYSRSLEGQEGQNFASMFANAIPQEPQAQGNVVDVGDYGTPDPNVQDGSLPRPFKRQPLLLKAPPTPGANGQTPSTSAPSPADSTQGSQQRIRPYPPHLHGQNAHQPHYTNQTMTAGKSGTAEEFNDPQRSTTSSPSPRIQSEAATPDSNGHIPERDIIDMINRANATKDKIPGARFDFPSALTHMENANGNSPLTSRQRNDVLSLMANTAATPKNGTNNALISPEPPPVPDVHHIGLNTEELDMLAKLQAEQADKVKNLTSMLRPLSPTGSIPGLTDNGYDNPQSIENDLDQFFNSNDYFSAQNAEDLGLGDDNGIGDGLNFDLYDTGNNRGGFNGFADTHGDEGNNESDELAGSRAETVISSAGTSPKAVVDDEGMSPAKRRRMN